MHHINLCLLSTNVSGINTKHCMDHNLNLAGVGDTGDREVNKDYNNT